MKDISNEVVALLLVIAIVISVLGTWLVLDNNTVTLMPEDSIGLTALATKGDSSPVSSNNTQGALIILEPTKES